MRVNGRPTDAIRCERPPGRRHRDGLHRGHAMTPAGSLDTEELLDRAGAGDSAARQQLLARHRARLRRTVAVRMDRRLAARVDASDIVQESLADAARQLDDYLRDRPIPFRAW